MKKSRLFLTFAISFLFILISYLSSSACGHYYEKDHFRVWFFLPTISNIPDLYPYTYSHHRYSKYYEKDNIQQLIKEQNVQNWKDVLGKDIKKDDISQLLYNTNPGNYFKTTITNNSFLDALNKSKNKEYKKYFDYAKICESVLSINDEFHLEGLSERSQVRDYGEKLITEIKTPWLKERIAYLLIKLNAYLGDSEKGKPIYKNYFSTQNNNSWLKGSATFHYACLMNDPIEKNYWLSKAFDGFNENKFLIKKKFNEKLKTETLNLAKTNREKAIIELIYGLDYPGKGLNQIKSIYKTSPEFDPLKFLLSREVNKLEDWLFSKKLKGNDRLKNKALKGDIEYLKDLREFVEKVVSDGKQKDEAFWMTTAAYLAFIDTDFAKARVHLDKLQNFENLSPNLKLQIKTTECLNTIFEKEISDEEIFVKIFDLYQYIDNNKNTIKESKNFKSEITLLLSDFLSQNGKEVRALLLLSRTNKGWKIIRSGLEENVYHRMLEDFDNKEFEHALDIIKSPETDFDKWIAKNLFDSNSWQEEDVIKEWNINKVLEYQSMYFLRQNCLDSALVVLKNIDQSYWNQEKFDRYLKRNPFSNGVSFSSIPLTNSNKRYTKITFLETLIELIYDVQNSSNPDQTKCLLIGNAYLNMTYHGNWWLMQSYAKSANEHKYTLTASKDDEHKSDYGQLFFFIRLISIFLVLVYFLHFIKERKTRLQLKFASSFLLLFLVFQFLSCTHKKVNSKKIIPKIETVKTDFKSGYYQGEMAKKWYQITRDINPNSEVGILADYMLTLGNKNKWAYTGQSYQIDIEKLSYSCLYFENYLKESGKKMPKN